MRAILVLCGGVVALVLAVAASCVALRSPSGAATPERAARDYFAAWGRGDFTAMRRLVDDPPADFAGRHRALSTALHVMTVAFEPAPAVREGDGADMDYKVTRELFGVGTWTFHAVLRLRRRDGRWRVRWSPATLYPSLADGGRLLVTRLDAAPATPVAADGKDLPAGSSVQPYLADVGDRFGDTGDPGWAVELQNPGASAQQVKVFGGGTKPVRTTLDRRLQAAAERAVGSKSAALVAVRPSTGEILAVADRLEEPKGAFTDLNPPGSTFKVITGAALLAGGTSPATKVGCPAVTVAAQRTIHNDRDVALGEVPLTRAFAESCNTTFARLGVAAGGHRLADAAASFGFGAHFDPGVPAYSGDFPRTATGNALAEASIGQGKVQATTLDMAVVAAAVADGTYRPPRLVGGHLTGELAGHRAAEPLKDAVTGGLRAMMGDVVRYGTAAHAGLPAGTHGKTGTAEYDSAGHAHAWFIGYRGDLAFAVFVERGGEGGRVAVPIAARFLL